MDFSEVLTRFDFEGEVETWERYGNGHINKTYLVKTADADKKHSYIVQKVNDGVFKEIDLLMENIASVTSFLSNKIIADGGDPLRETMNIIKTVDGRTYFKDQEDGYYRAFVFVENSLSYDAVESPELFKKSGIAFGKFQKLLSDYPAHTLHETIKDFHNTKVRYENLMRAVERNASGRAADCAADIEFVKVRKADTEKLVTLIEKNELPLKVTHNDTKLNNVMFDKDTNNCICVVDLDTVMPGLALYDFGDSIRFGANTACEDEKDLSKITIDLEYFKAYTEGFLSEAGDSMTAKEIEYLAFAAKLMTLECGIRFLTDYIDGDVYFATAYPEHNLVRARDQFKLVEEMEKHMDEMNEIVRNAVK